MRKSSYVNIKNCLDKINKLLDNKEDPYEVAKLYRQIGNCLIEEGDYVMAIQPYLLAEKYGMSMLAEFKIILNIVYDDSAENREIYLRLVSNAPISGGYFYGLLGKMYEEREEKEPQKAYKHYLLGAKKGDLFSIKRAISYVGFFTDYEEMLDKESALLLYKMLAKKNPIKKWDTGILYDYAIELITLPLNENDVETRKEAFFRAMRELFSRGFEYSYWSRILSLAENFFYFNKQGSCECIAWSPTTAQKLLLMMCIALEGNKEHNAEKEFYESLKLAIYRQYLYLNYIGEKEKAELFLKFI